MDASILAWVAAHRSAPLDSVMLALTVAGWGGAVWVALAAVRTAAIPRFAMAAWQTVVALLLGWAISGAVLKPLVQRERPSSSVEALGTAGAPPAGYSFPSGHATAAAAGASMLAAAWPAARAGLWVLAIGISLSRVYLDAHYPSDVLAGFLLGCAVAWFVRGRTVWRQPPARSST